MKTFLWICSARELQKSLDGGVSSNHHNQYGQCLVAVIIFVAVNVSIGNISWVQCSTSVFTTVSHCQEFKFCKQNFPQLSIANEVIFSKVLRPNNLPNFHHHLYHYDGTSWIQSSNNRVCDYFQVFQFRVVLYLFRIGVVFHQVHHFIKRVIKSFFSLADTPPK